MLNDLRHALRALGQNRGFAATAIFSIALAIGANSAIFSMADGLLFRPLPVRDPASSSWGSGRVRAIGGAREGSPIESRIFRVVSGGWIAETIRSSPPHSQGRASNSQTRRISSAQA
jgi:hypothetical protein